MDERYEDDERLRGWLMSALRGSRRHLVEVLQVRFVTPEPEDEAEALAPPSIE